MADVPINSFCIELVVKKFNSILWLLLDKLMKNWHADVLWQEIVINENKCEINKLI